MTKTQHIAFSHSLVRSVSLFAVAATLAACGSKSASTGETAGKPTDNDNAAAAPAAAAPRVDKKLANVGAIVNIPANAQIAEEKTDTGGFQATISFDGMANFFVSNVNDASDSYDTTVHESRANAWKVQDHGGDGKTWKLEWTSPDVIDPTATKFGIAVRAAVGAKLVDCGGNGLSEAQATTLLQICSSMKG